MNIGSKDPLMSKLKMDRQKRKVDEQKENIFGDENYEEVRSHSLRDLTESYDISVEEKNEEASIMHYSAIEMLGLKSQAIGMNQKLEELKMLKKFLFGPELELVIQKFVFKVELYEK